MEYKIIACKSIDKAKVILSKYDVFHLGQSSLFNKDLIIVRYGSADIGFNISSSYNNLLKTIETNSEELSELKIDTEEFLEMMKVKHGFIVNKTIFTETDFNKNSYRYENYMSTCCYGDEYLEEIHHIEIQYKEDLYRRIYLNKLGVLTTNGINVGAFIDNIQSLLFIGGE